MTTLPMIDVPPGRPAGAPPGRRPAQSATGPLALENIPALQAEVRDLAGASGAVILAHNYQLPEIQQVADYVGDSLGLSRQAAATGAEEIIFCGVHFMAETASVLSPHKRVIIPDADAGCSLADSITVDQLRAWKERFDPARRVVVMYVNTTAAVKAETDYCVTSANAVAVVAHILATHPAGPENVEILFGPDMFLGAYVERTLGVALHVWDGECHVHAGIRPEDINRSRAAHPDADFLIHPECGCSTPVLEFISAGDVAAEGVHMLSTGGMLDYARRHAGGDTGGGSAGEGLVGERRTAIVATETGMLHGLRAVAPNVDFIAANEAASCRYMKMITLPKLRDALAGVGGSEVKVDPLIAERARIPIERMVAIG